MWYGNIFYWRETSKGGKKEKEKEDEKTGRETVSIMKDNFTNNK